MKNEYEIRGDITAIIINSHKYGIKEALISTSKLEEIKKFPNSWFVNKQNNMFYVVGCNSRINGKQPRVSLHRFIMNNPDGFIIDHIDRDGLNNTDSNLRIVTKGENNQNLGKYRKNSRSGIRGVGWSRTSKKWKATIHVNNHAKHIGYFDDIKEAESSVIAARMKYMPFSNENI